MKQIKIKLSLIGKYGKELAVSSAIIDENIDEVKKDESKFDKIKFVVDGALYSLIYLDTTAHIGEL